MFYQYENLKSIPIEYHEIIEKEEKIYQSAVDEIEKSKSNIKSMTMKVIKPIVILIGILFLSAVLFSDAELYASFAGWLLVSAVIFFPQSFIIDMFFSFKKSYPKGIFEKKKILVYKNFYNEVLAKFKSFSGDIKDEYNQLGLVKGVASTEADAMTSVLIQTYNLDGNAIINMKLDSSKSSRVTAVNESMLSNNHSVSTSTSSEYTIYADAIKII